MFNKKRIIIFFIFILLMFFLMTFAGTPIQNASVATRQVIFTDGYNGKDISTQTVEVGKDAVVPEAPYHKGYAFAGWFKYENHKVRVKDFTNILRDLHVIALYGRDANNNGIPDDDDTWFTVTFVNNRTNAVLKTQSVLVGMDATAPKAPVITGYKFVGWDKNFTNVQNDLTVYTIYKKNGGNTDETIYTLTINYVYEDGSKAADTYSKSVNYANRNYKVTSPTIEGYTPDKAVVEGTIGNDGNKDKVETVTYSPATNIAYKVQHYKENVNKNGYDLAETENFTGTYNENVTAKSKTYEGFTFNNSIEGTVETGTVKLDGSLVLKLYYTRNTHVVIVDPKCNPDEEVCEVIEDPDEPFGKDITLPALERKYTLTYNEPNVPADKQLGTQTFEAVLVGYCKNATTCDNPIPGGSKITVEDEDVTYNAVWDETALTQAVKEGASYETETYDYTFTHWLDVDQIVNAGDDITLAANKTLEAQYTPEGHPYTLTVTYKYEDGREASQTHTETVKYDEQYDVDSPVIAGYKASLEKVSGKMPAEDKTIDVVYTAKTDTKYIVETYVMKEDMETYDMTSEEKNDGVTDQTKTITPETKEGFTLNETKSVLSGTVSATEPYLVLKVYYDRNTHTVIVDPNCNPEEEVCTPIEDPDEPFGKEITLPALERKYTLTYKEADELDNNTTTDTKEMTLVGYCKNATTCENPLPGGSKVTVEDEDVTYNAVWTGSLETTIKDGRNYQTATDVYTFNKWSKYTVGQTITLTKSEQIDAEYIGLPRTYTLTINYVYKDGSIAAEQHTEEVVNGKTYNVVNPPANKEGYSPETEAVTGTMPTENLTVDVLYLANTDTQYKVEHYKENKDKNGYDLAETETLGGETDTEATATPKVYEGFTFNNTVEGTVEKGTITGDGKLVLKLYYTRDTHSVTIDPNCNPEEEVCTPIENPDEPFGKDITLPQLERKYTLTYKEADELENNTTTDTKEMTLVGYCKNATTCENPIPAGEKVTVETEDVTYNAVWTGSLDVRIKSGRDYQTATDVYTFTGWSKYTVGEIVTLTKSEEITAQYTSETREYTLTVTYKYEDGKEAAQTHTENVKNGVTYTVNSPEIAGYTANPETVTGTMPTEDKTVNVVYSANTNTKYIIETYVMNEDLTTYEMTSEDKFDGVTDQTKTITPEEKEGFTLNETKSVLSGTVSATEPYLVLKVYYDRNTHTVIVDPNCNPEEEVCKPIEDPDEPFGKEITLPQLERKYTLTYSEPNVPADKQLGTQVFEAVLVGYCKNATTCENPLPGGSKVTVEDEDVTYNAVWTETGLTQAVKAGSGYETETYDYTFSHWLDGSTEIYAGTNITLTADKTIEAQYTPEGHPYTLTVTYKYEDGTTAAQNHTETVKYNDQYSVTSPEIAGYTPYPTVVEGKMPAENKTVNVEYKANTGTKYTVKFYKNSTGEADDYVFFESIERSGKTGTTAVLTVSELENRYTGYTLNQTKTEFEGKIAGDGSLVLNVYYDINVYNIKVTYRYADNAYAATSIEETKLHGETYSYTTEPVAGYTANKAVVSGTATADVNEEVVYTPNNDTKYIVETYVMKLDGETYNMTSTENEGITNDTVRLTPEERTGFTLNSTKSKLNGVITAGENKLVLKVYYDRNSYTLSYSYKTGTTPKAPALPNGGTYLYEAPVTIAEPLTLTGYTFDGWYNGETKVTSLNMPAEDVELTATFTANTTTEYTVETYVMNLDGETYAMTSETKNDGVTDQTKTITPETREGFTLNETKSVLSGTVTAEEPFLVLKVYYDRNSHTVSYRYTGESTTMYPALPGNETHYYGATVNVANEPTLTGYTFDGWYNGTNKVTSLTMPDDDVELTGSFSANTNTAYRVEHYQENIDDNGYTLKEGRDETGTTGTLVSEDAKTYTGFTYDSSVEGTLTSGPIAGDGSLVLKLYYKRNTHKLSYTYTNTVTGAPELPAEETYKYGKEITLIAKPTLVGYTFDGWYNGTNTVTTVTMPDEDVRITGSWTANTNTAYKVEHYWQNVDNDEYTLHETENLTGTTGTTVNATVKTYTGFVHNTNNNDVLTNSIAGDGSTVLKVYYDRETYTVTWKNGNTTLETDTNVKYGSKPSYDSATPTKADTHVTTGGDWTYNHEFARWMDGTNPLTDSTVVTGNVTYNAQFMHLEPEVNAGKQLEFEKNSNVSEVREVITVNVVYDDGTVKESNVSGYTLEGFDSSDYTENKVPARTSDPLTTRYNGLHNDKLRYKIVLNAGTSKFEVEMSIPSANNNGKYEYIATKNTNCVNNCDVLSNTTYTEKRELDKKFLELTERYNSNVEVRNVYIKYKNGKTVHASIMTGGLIDGTVVRYDYKFRKNGKWVYHLPTRIAQVKGMDLREAYVRSEGMYINRDEAYPENAFNGYGAPLTGNCTSNRCVYYFYTKSVGTYNSSTTYYRFNGTRYNSYTPTYNDIIDVELPENGLEIDEVVIIYHREASTADNEAAGTFKVTYAYIGGEFRVKSEVEVNSNTITADENVGIIYNSEPSRSMKSMKVETPVEEETVEVETETVEETKENTINKEEPTEILETETIVEEPKEEVKEEPKETVTNEVEIPVTEEETKTEESIEEAQAPSIEEPVVETPVIEEKKAETKEAEPEVKEPEVQTPKVEEKKAEVQAPKVVVEEVHEVPTEEVVE